MGSPSLHAEYWPCLFYPHHPASFPSLHTPTRTRPTPSDATVQPESITSIRLFSTYKDGRCKRFSLICHWPPALSAQAHCAQQSGFSVRHMLTEAPVPGRFLQVSSTQLVPNEAYRPTASSAHPHPGLSGAIIAALPPAHLGPLVSPPTKPVSRHTALFHRAWRIERPHVTRARCHTVKHSSQLSLGVPSCLVRTSGQTAP